MGMNCEIVFIKGFKGIIIEMDDRWNYGLGLSMDFVMEVGCLVRIFDVGFILGFYWLVLMIWMMSLFIIFCCDILVLYILFV